MTRTRSEKGSTLIELLVAIILIGLLGLASIKNQVMALQAGKLTEVNHVASSLVISRIEEIGVLKTSQISTSLNETDTTVTTGGLSINYLRTTAVTVNLDGSRDVQVTVRSDSSHTPTEVQFETTFTPWD